MQQFYLCPVSFYLSSLMPFAFLFMNSRAEPTCVITVGLPFYINSAGMQSCLSAHKLTVEKLPVISWREFPSIRQWLFSSDCPKFILSPSEMIKEDSKCPHQQLLCSKPGLLLSMERTLLKSVSLMLNAVARVLLNYVSLLPSCLELIFCLWVTLSYEVTGDHKLFL